MLPIEKIRRAAALSLGEWLLLSEAWIELGFVELQLAISPARAVRGALEPRAGRPHATHDLPESLLEMFGVAARHHVYHPTCLPKALALFRMIERRGFGPVLRIGARKEGSTLLGHAWVELDGVPFNDAADVADHYAPLSISESALVVWTSQ